MTINLLSEEIINQIAAGEVIENPSAVIKELIENSIDANSDEIEIELKNSGLTSIIIKDNGVGISKDDLLKAPLRHATSKIQKFDDLYSIKTMGFRGEALASIFSISNSKIISKISSDKNAYEITSENLTDVKLSANKDGTTIIIENLFYNTPARKKYLKSESLELKSVLDVLNRFEVCYPQIKITLKNNDKLLVNKPKFKSYEDNLFYVLGKELRENLIKIETKIKGLEVFGFIGKPSSVTYAIKKNQYLYVNNRYVKSRVLTDAIYRGFGTNLMENRHPMYVIYIKVDPEIIDVNIHPTKIEVKFENELEIYEFVRDAIKETFEKNEMFKPFDKDYNEKKADKYKSEGNIILEHFDSELKLSDLISNESFKEITNEPKSYFTKETQKELQSFRVSELESQTKNILKEESSTPYALRSELEYGPLYEILKDYRIVGQVNKTFIIIETKTEMIIIDQHVAEEKFFYETFKDMKENSQVIKSQSLLKPEIVRLTLQEMLLYNENLELIKKLGFKTEEFGENEVVVRAIPISFDENLVSAETLKDILHEITVDKKFKSLENESLEKLASMSCKKSIKAGHEMTNPEIHTMIENLKKLKEPFNCPHGRPILLNWKYTELEKKFKRIV